MADAQHKKAASVFKSAAGAEIVRAGYAALLAHWPIAHEQMRIPTAQGETFVIACGTEGKPPLVLLHGSMSTAAMWMREVTCWAPHFRLYVVDIIGEPGLSAPSRPQLGSDAHAQWLDEVMDALELPSAGFVGISLGGWFSLDYATRRPNRVDLLALIVPSGVGAQRNFLLWAAPLSLFGSWGRNKILAWVVGPAQADEDTPDEVKELFSAHMAQINAHFRPRVEKLPIFTDRQLRDLGMPVMAVVAGKDVILDAHSMKKRLEENVSNLTLRYLPAAHHFPGDQSQPILEFLLAAHSDCT